MHRYDVEKLKVSGSVGRIKKDLFLASLDVFFRNYKPVTQPQQRELQLKTRGSWSVR